MIWYLASSPSAPLERANFLGLVALCYQVKICMPLFPSQCLACWSSCASIFLILLFVGILISLFCFMPPRCMLSFSSVHTYPLYHYQVFVSRTSVTSFFSFLLTYAVLPPMLDGTKHLRKEIRRTTKTVCSQFFNETDSGTRTWWRSWRYLRLQFIYNSGILL